MKRVKYKGKLNKRTLIFLEKYGYDESQLHVTSTGELYALYDEDENVRHPDDPRITGQIEHFVSDD